MSNPTSISLNEEEVLFAITSILKDPTDLVMAQMIYESFNSEGLQNMLKYILSGVNPYENLLVEDDQCYFDMAGYVWFINGRLIEEFENHPDCINGYILVKVVETQKFDSSIIGVKFPGHLGKDPITTTVTRRHLIPIKEFHLSHNQVNESDL